MIISSNCHALLLFIGGSNFKYFGNYIFIVHREEIERQKAHERYMKLQEQGKTEQARKDLGMLLEYTLLFR